MSPVFSCVIMHTPWVPERVRCVNEMILELNTNATRLHVLGDERPSGMPWSKFKTVLAMRQWHWALSTDATHHVFLTDDLHLHPCFWNVLSGMVQAKPSACIGLLSNHPRGPELYAKGARWYRCNSWIVGPAYVIPRYHLEQFLAWYLRLPDTEDKDGRRWYNDDSAINEWITHFGPRESWHPLPTIIEHRHDIGSTVGHGDRYSRERVSWRALRRVETNPDGLGFSWKTDPITSPGQDVMGDRDFWNWDGQMLLVGGEG